MILRAKYLLFLMVVAGVCLMGGTVSAVSNIGPDPSDYGAIEGDVFRYVLNQDSDATITTINIPLYYPDNSYDRFVTITGGDVCWGAAGWGTYMTAPGGNNYRDSNRNNLAAGTQVTTFSVPGATSIKGNISYASDCYKSTGTMSIPKSSLVYDASTGLYKTTMTAAIVGTYAVQNRFQLETNADGLIGYTASTAASGYGVAREYPYKEFREYRIPFAPPCSMTADAPARITMYDDDNFDTAIQGGKPMVIKVEQYSSTGASEGYVPFTSYAAMDWVSSNTLRPHAGNSQDAWAEFTAKPGKKYRLWVSSVYYVNILQFQLPYDSINYNLACKKKWVLDGTTTSSQSVVLASTPIVWTHRVWNTTGADPTDVTIDYEVIQIINGGAETVAASGSKPPSVEAGDDITTAPYQTTFTGGTAGDRICQRIRWTPGAWDDETSKESSPVCVTIARMPISAIIGSDASAGGSVSAPCTGLAGFKGSSSSGFGSFGEYGLIATGDITSFSSAGRVPSNGLSFANTGGVTGRYRQDHCITDIKSAYATKGSAASATALPPGGTLPQNGDYAYRTGNITINTSTNLQGKYLIYAPGQTVRITGNITYQKNIAHFADAASLVIIAQNIDIDAGVTQIDGVLYATNRILTCAQSGDSPIVKSALKSGGPCDRPTLLINGAAISEKDIKATRTSGGNNVTDPPAEIYRLRPEAFLAPIELGTGSVLTTVSETELPPRN